MPEVDSPLNLSSPPISNNPSNASILIVDDEAGIRESLEVLLTLEGYQVRMASDGAQGLRILELENFDLVLLDLALPGQSGLELLTLIKERQPELEALVKELQAAQVELEAARKKVAGNPFGDLAGEARKAEADRRTAARRPSSR